jgi:DNA-binding response OmpR family regulator
MAQFPVFIMDKDAAAGEWVRSQLAQIGVEAQWITTVSDLISEAEAQPTTVCLVSLRPPVGQTFALITELTQEPRFAQTSFVLMGPVQYKHASFEAGADDYITTPPEVIELRKRVRLYLDRAQLEARVVAETRITQEMERLMGPPSEGEEGLDQESLTLLEHAAALSHERDFFEMVLRFAGQAMAFVTTDATLLYANPAWETLIGKKCGLTAGDTLEWPPTAIDPAATRAIATAVAEQRPWRGQIRCALPDGGVLDLLMTITPAEDVDGDLLGYVATYLSVAARKSA